MTSNFLEVGASNWAFKLMRVEAHWLELTHSTLCML